MGTGEAHAGHFLAGRGNAILFDERGTNLQCATCNIDLGGNYDKYLQFIITKYGQDTVDELVVLKNTTVKMYSSDYKEKARIYKRKTVGLLHDRTNLLNLS